MPAKKDLVSEYAGFLSYLSDEFYGKAKAVCQTMAEKNDFYSAGVIGLLEANKRFDQTRCDKFQPFAIMSIRWAMQKELNRICGKPAWYLNKQRRLSEGTAVLEHLLGRQATKEEMADFFSVDVAKLENLESLLGSVLRVQDSQVDLSDLQQVEYDFEDEMTRSRLYASISKALNKLTRRQREVMNLHFYWDLTVLDISKLLHVSEAGVCNTKARALKTIVDELREELPDLFEEERICS